MTTDILDCSAEPAAEQTPAAVTLSEHRSAGPGVADAPRIAARTAAGARAMRRRARKVAVRRPPSGLIPGTRVMPAVSADRLPEVSGVGYRLGRWARLATTITVLGVMVAVTCVALAPSPSLHTESHRVKSGETLWSIARDAQPDADPRAVIQQIRSANDIDGDTLPIGLVLQVPTADG